MPKQTFFNLPEEKRQRIIEIALDEFASLPYSKASLSRVVEKAGIAKGSMYQYFEDKKDLFTYLVELAAQKKLAYLQGRSFDREADFFTKLEQMLLAGVRFNLENPKLGRLVASALDPAGDPFLRELFEQMRRMSRQYLADLFRQGQAARQVRSDLEPRLAAHVISAVLGDGLLEYLQETLGIGYLDFLRDVKAIERLGDEEVHRIVKQIMAVIRSGLEGEI